MAITKTNFINFSRCPRYAALDDIKKTCLTNKISIEEYKKQEEDEYVKEILNDMYDGDIDLIDVKDEQLEVMMPYYNLVELMAGHLAKNYFKGTFKYSKDTYNQESFDCIINNIRYLCYIDIYNEYENGFNIIEAKATTTKKYFDLKINDTSIFTKDKNGIYHLLEELDDNLIDIKKYNTHKAKLFDRYTDVGHYVYDLAVQRYIIENDLKNNGNEDKIDNIRYYLAILNSEYVFDGTYENNEPVYKKDKEGNDIISFIDFTNITKDYLDIIDIDRKKVEKYINELNTDETKLGIWCESKKTTKCKFCPVCFKKLPAKNSIMAYLDGHHGFKDKDGNKYERFDLINDGYVSMLDIPKEYLNRYKNVIQREVVETKTPYYDNEKIIDGLKQLTYPIYHLDFETFPCPFPRFKGEKCYSQSVFQFSLHIEKEEGKCDKDKDHFEYLAVDIKDHREELVKKLCDWIGDTGTVLVYNESFEKTRLKELAEIFPEYKTKLLKIRSMIFDLMNIVKTKTSMYEELGYDKQRASLFNYYHADLNGSFSIKKVLPLFSDLTYQGMDISNGGEALITYAKFPTMDKKEYEYKYQKLLEYCKQDTWAMFCILEGLRKYVKNCQICPKEVELIK